MQRCEQCGALRWTPRDTCPECLTPGGTWSEIETGGVIWSFVVYHRAFHPSFADAVPYNVALVQLDAGPVAVTSIQAPNGELEIGRRVHVVFDDVTPDVTLVRFVLDP